MGKHYTRKTERGQYGEQRLLDALSLLKGESYRSVSKKSGIPRRTLQRHNKGQVQLPGKPLLGRFRPVFSSDIERQLTDHLLDLQSRFYGLTIDEVRQIAFKIAEQIGDENRFNTHQQLAGKNWVRCFLQRHPELAVRSPEATSMSRATGFNKAQVMRFFENLREALVENAIDDSSIWNMDESGLTAVHKPGRIISKKGQKQVGKITSGERGKTVTIICAMSARGSYVPPLMIFPRKTLNSRLMADAPPGSIAAATDSGWTDKEVFVKWMNHFISIAKPTPQKKVLLLLDGHTSHISLDSIELARIHGVIMICIPPHTSHKLQPLDRTFFGPLKSAYNSECDKWMVNHPGGRISFYEIGGLFASAYTRVASIDKAISGFRCTGCWPYNPDVFTDVDFAPSLVTEEDEPSDGNGTGMISILQHPMYES